MEIVSLSPLRAASLVWRPRGGGWILTVVARATYALSPVESPLAERQEDPSDEDNHWNDDPARSVYAPSDFAPFKARADVMLVGHAFAPRGEPVRSLVVRLLVGEIDKSIEVYRERTWTMGGGLREGARFVKMPLRYERAAGGPGTSNPVGVRSDGSDVHGGTPVPNLQPPGLALASPADFIEPVGYGPIAPAWPSRRERLGRQASSWSPARWNEHPLPEDMDPGFFNAAPRDQQVEALRDNERLVLEHLHPQHPRLVTSLPGIHPRAFADRPGGAPHEVAMTCDTLWIDTDRGLCTLTWRGQLHMESATDPGRILVAMETPGHRIGWDDVERLSRSSDRVVLAPGGLDSVEDQNPTESIPAVSGVEPALPFRPSDGPPAIPASAPRSTPPPGDAAGTTASDLVAVADASPAWLGPTGRSSRPPHRSGAAEAPPRASQPPLSPWASGLSASPERSASSVRNAALAPVVLPPLPSSSAAYDGAVAASNAAAAQAPATASDAPPARPVTDESAPAPAREVVELLWFDPAAAARGRACYAELAADIEFEPPDRRHDLPPDDPAKAAERHLVFGLLTEAPRLASNEVGDAIAASVSDRGRFTAPLCVVAGELHLPFDELETLKASVSIVAPLVAGDPKLKKELDAVTEAVASPTLSRSTGLIEKLTQHVRGLFTQIRTPMPGHYLDTYTERTLLEGRHHQRRVVFGAPHIRALLGGSGDGAPVPTYLPEALVEQMPRALSLRVRLLAEAHLCQDVYETHAAALRVLALARVVSLEGLASKRADPSSERRLRK